MTTSRPRLYLTSEQPCSYLDDRSARNLLVDPEFELDQENYGFFLSQGFRRSGEHVYRPQCANCSNCVPVRVRALQHVPSKSQRRTLKKNADLAVSCVPASYTDEYFDLYTRYLVKRHAGSPMVDSTQEQFKEFLVSEWCNTDFMEVRLDGALLAVAVTDVTVDGLSAVYTFFDPTLEKRNLGKYCILQQIRLTAERELPHLYLGYWISQCGNMAYKRDYQPLEGFFHMRSWELLTAETTVEATRDPQEQPQ